MAWAGWGAGPAGAGSAGGPSRAFLGAAAVGAAIVTVVLALDGAPAALLTGAAAVYFGLRSAGKLGPRDPT
jgi:hypothetical protein